MAHAASEARAADSVENLADQFIQRYSKIRNKTWRQVEIFQREVLPRWKGESVHEITKESVEDLVGRIADNDRPFMANRTLAAIRKWFAWMAGRSKGGHKALLAARLRTTPCLGIEAPGEEHSRERTLTDAEIAALWAASGKEGEPYGSLSGCSC